MKDKSFEIAEHHTAQCEISAVSYSGLSIAMPDGRPAKLAVVDDEGHILECGPEVAEAVWHVAITSYRQFLMGEGHLRVLVKPHN
jgi:hypothetical protein